MVSLFGFMGEDLLDGWLQVESSSPAVTGFLTYGTPSTGSAATVTPSRLGQRRAIFSHIETSQGFFTGLAILNPGQLAANVQTVVLTKTGEVVGTSSTVLQPGQRISQLIDQLVPEAQGQHGYCRGRDAEREGMSRKRGGRAQDGEFMNQREEGAVDDAKSQAAKIIDPHHLAAHVRGDGFQEECSGR